MASSLPPRPLSSGALPANAPNAILVQLERTKEGGYRLSTPYARGWAATARNPVELAKQISTAFLEVQVASYARQRGQVYDLDGLTGCVPGDPLADRPPTRERKPGPRRRRSHSPADWQMTDNGRWRSPGGRVYSDQTRVVQRVLARRQELGLPVT